MKNQIKIKEVTIDISDELLTKLIHSISKSNNMTLPMHALLSMPMKAPPKESIVEKPTIGFKT